MRRVARQLVLAVFGAAMIAGCGGVASRPPAGVVRIDLGFGRGIPVRWVRVGQPLLVRVSSRLGLPGASPESVVAPARWHAPDCSPARCYAMSAKSPGTANLAAMFRCGGEPGAAYCAGAVASVYVEPAVCRARAVSMTPTSRRPTRAGPLSVVALAARGAGSRPAGYVVARFSEAGNPAYLDRALYQVTIDWGDRSAADGVAAPIGTVRGSGNGPYEVMARHFYCEPGRYTATVQVTENGAASFSGVTETATVKTVVAVRP